MTRSAMLRSQGATKKSAASAETSAADDSSAKLAARDLPPDATLPATPAQMLALNKEPGEAPASAPRPAEAPAAPPRKAAPPRNAAPPRPASPPTVETSSAEPPSVSSAQEPFGLVLKELRELRALQERILDLLERAPAARGGSSDDEAEVSPIRVRRRKSVVLIDDDPATREAAVAEMTQADIPVRAFPDGNAAVSAIADEKPDVIVLELGLTGVMEGRDVINMVKATMEWVDIPIVLWTREPVQSQREARQVHGSDEVVLKSSGAPALVARVITLFRRVH